MKIKTVSEVNSQKVITLCRLFYKNIKFKTGSAVHMKNAEREFKYI